jgi:hypothetical protein
MVAHILFGLSRMTQAFAIPHPKRVMGLILLALSFWPALEGIFLFSFPEVFIALVLAGIGWRLCRQKIVARSDIGGNTLRESLTLWARFTVVTVPLAVIVYFTGYLVLMNRHLPTAHFRNDDGYFESSFRWAPKQHISKGEGPRTGCPEVTILNIVYRPLDRLYFKYFQRSDAEVERLRALGYYQ